MRRFPIGKGRNFACAEDLLGESDWQLLASFTERLTSAAIRAETMRFSNGGAKPPLVPRP